MYNEVEEVLLNVKINLNNRPLTYFKDDIQKNVLTSNRVNLGRNMNPIDSTVGGSKSFSLLLRRNTISVTKKEQKG